MQKILGHAHLSKTTPHLIVLAIVQNLILTTAYLESGFTTCLEHGHYYHYHQVLCYVNQCICMTKHFSSAAFYTVTQTIWGGGLQPPKPPSKSAYDIVLYLCVWVHK